MQLGYVWRSCNRVSGDVEDRAVDSFVIACTPEESDANVLPYLTLDPGGVQLRSKREDNEPGEVEYFLVSRDLASVVQISYYYPIDNKFGGASPMYCIEQPLELARLEDLATLEIPFTDAEKVDYTAQRRRNDQNVALALNYTDAAGQAELHRDYRDLYPHLYGPEIVVD